eukprot:1009544-Rhodomonas_salina.1
MAWVDNRSVCVQPGHDAEEFERAAVVEVEGETSSRGRRGSTEWEINQSTPFKTSRLCPSSTSTSSTVKNTDISSTGSTEGAL